MISLMLQNGNPQHLKNNEKDSHLRECQDKVCEADGGVKFNPFYLREMRRTPAGSQRNGPKQDMRIEMDEGMITTIRVNFVLTFRHYSSHGS